MPKLAPVIDPSDWRHGIDRLLAAEPSERAGIVELFLTDAAGRLDAATAWQRFEYQLHAFAAGYTRPAALLEAFNAMLSDCADAIGRMNLTGEQNAQRRRAAKLDRATQSKSDLLLALQSWEKYDPNNVFRHGWKAYLSRTLGLDTRTIGKIMGE